MMNKIITFMRNTFLAVGDTGTTTMCFGWFHEVEIPKELKEKK